MKRSGERAELWLPLLRRVTRAFPRWSVWKNVESALTGHGDVDSFAPAEDWPAIERVWLEWLDENGLRPAIVCRHVPQGPHYVALDPDSPWLVQFDVKLLATFRGATLMDVDDLQELAEIDERGFRRIRPGSEGVIKLVFNGLRPGGRKNPEGLRVKGVVDLLESDPEGVRLAAKLFGPAEGSILAGVAAVLSGEWNRPAMAAVEAWALGKALTEPKTSVGRVWFNQVSKKRCPILRVIREEDRRVPADRDDWMRSVEEVEMHRVVRR